MSIDQAANLTFFLIKIFRPSPQNRHSTRISHRYYCQGQLYTKTIETCPIAIYPQGIRKYFDFDIRHSLFDIQYSSPPSVLCPLSSVIRPPSSVLHSFRSSLTALYTIHKVLPCRPTAVRGRKAPDRAGSCANVIDLVDAPVICGQVG